MRIVAIDPGKSGSATFMHGFKISQIISFPFTPDWRRILHRAIWLDRPDLCKFEFVHSFAGQGIVTTAEFMRATGAQETIVEVCDVPIEYVRPVDWQRRLGLPHGRTRDQRRKDQKALALERFPELKSWDEIRDLPDGGRARPDIWASVCIAYAGALDAEKIKLGELA